MGQVANHPILDAAVYSVDDKQRMALPASFRYFYSPGGQGPFILTVGAGHCLSVYSTAEWDLVRQHITPRFLGLDRQTFARYTRWLLARTTLAQADVQGRIKIPQPLISYAKIEHEALALMMVNRLEIWNPGEHEKFIGAVEDFADAQNRLQFDTMYEEQPDFLTPEIASGIPDFPPGE